MAIYGLSRAPRDPQKLITQPRPQPCSCVLLACVRGLVPNMRDPGLVA